MLLEGTELSHHLNPGTLRACSVRRRNYPTTSIRALSADAPWGDGATPSSVQTAFWNCYLLLIFCLNDFFIAPAIWQGAGMFPTKWHPISTFYRMASESDFLQNDLRNRTYMGREASHFNGDCYNINLTYKILWKYIGECLGLIICGSHKFFS